MTTYPLATLSCTVDEFGISAPTYDDILNSLVASFQAIYGSDIIVTADSMDGQWLGILALAIHNNNNATITTYQAFSPATAQGNGLASVIKINGLRKQAPSRSTASLTLIGRAGTPLGGKLVGDDLGLGTQWRIADGTNIPIGGEIAATGTCTIDGAVEIPADHLNVILTPTAGWQSVTNPGAATPGAPTETDAALRTRQAESTAISAETVNGAIIGTVANVAGVLRHKLYENSTNATDSDGIPAHSIAVVVEGGDDQAIINAIGSKKTPGTGTFGDTSGVYTDPAGIDQAISFQRLTDVSIDVVIVGDALVGYVSTTDDLIKAAVAAYINALVIGEDVYYTRLFAPATFDGAGLGLTYDISALTICISGGSPAAANVDIDFDEAATCDVVNITVTIT